MSAPARRIEVSVSRIAGSRSIQPLAAAASTMAYSPETLYAATGTSTASRTRRDDVEVGQRRLHHHDVGALLDVEQRLAHALDGVARGPAGRCAGRPRSEESTASRNGPKNAEAYFAE